MAARIPARSEDDPTDQHTAAASEAAEWDDLEAVHWYLVMLNDPDLQEDPADEASRKAFATT